MFEEKSGMVMWREWRTTVWQRSPEIIVHRECATEAGRRNDGRQVSTIITARYSYFALLLY
jgi:hypothetical protein